MSYRVILVPLFGAETDASALNAALGIARRFEARVRGLFVSIDPTDVVPYVGEGVAPSTIEQLMEATRVEVERQRTSARGVFDSACSASGMAVTEQFEEHQPCAAQWVEVTGPRAETVANWGRVCDLLVFCREQATSDVEARVVETALFGSARPLLLVPRDWSGSLGHKLAVAWNGSLEGARAIGSAMPFLEAAVAVHVLTAQTPRTDFEITRGLAEYLRAHGAPCDRHLVSLETEPVGAALLRQAADLEADLLVLGGYSRSRLREMILGGVTRHVLAHARLPVLMAH